MATKMCEMDGSCNREGTATCVNKWRKRECRCKPGWENMMSDDCSEDVDECANDGWCKNEGECTNTVGSFICLCPQGWEGAQCENDINECEAATNPCLNNGVCSNTDGSYTCSCPNNWTGDNCEIDVNECTAEEGDPCANDSPCINTEGSYQCLCSNGWGGQNCDTDYDECGNGMCPQGTVCQALDMNQFTCVCPERGCNNLDEVKYNELLASVTVDQVVEEVVDPVESIEEGDYPIVTDYTEFSEPEPESDSNEEIPISDYTAPIDDEDITNDLNDDTEEIIEPASYEDNLTEENRPYEEDSFLNEDVQEEENGDMDSLASEGDDFYSNYS